MTLRGAAFIVGAYEHPLREIPDSTVAQIHAEVALGALTDAGLTLADVDAYFCAGDAPGFGPLSMAEYLGLALPLRRTRPRPAARRTSSHVGHAAAAIAAGKCRRRADHARGQAAHRRRAAGRQPGVPRRARGRVRAALGQRRSRRQLRAGRAARHMYEFGTTSEQLAEIKVAASLHAQHNPNAFLRDVGDRRRGASTRRWSPTRCTASTAA